MRTHRRMKSWWPLSYAVLAALSALLIGGEALAAATDLQKIYVEHRRKPAHTQVVLFFKGARPKKLAASSTPEEYIIKFQELTTKLKQEEIIQDSASAIRAITVSTGTGNASRIQIQYRHPQSVTKALILPATLCG
jgi:hypothetical protein